jgi:adenosine deaminase
MAQDHIGTYPLEFIRALPKSDLHVHLDGSLRIPTLIRLARKHKLKLPSYTEEGLRQKVFKSHYKSLEEYLVGFCYTTAVMQTPEALEQTAYEFAQDNIDEGVVYVEVRFAPQLHVNEKQDMARVLQSVNAGLSRAKLEQNTLPDVAAGRKPPFEYGIICCALRQFGQHYSPYYSSLYGVHPYTPPKEIYPIASLELAKAAVEIRDRHAIPIVGFDLAGEEAGYPAEDHWEAFDYVHRHFIKKTVHAGEAFGPESIFQAITDLKADRIGHGYYLFQVGSITDKSIRDKHQYVRALAEYIADRRITIEVCLTSNMQTNPRIRDLSSHAFKLMHKSNLSTTFCTDNRLVSNTNVTKELHLAANTFGLRKRELKDIIIYGFKRSFFPGSYQDKRQYVRNVIDYYEGIERKHFGQIEPKL